MSILVEKAIAQANPSGMGRWFPWKRDEPADPPGGAAPPTFEDLYSERIGYVWHVLRRLGVRGEEREDVIQDVFVCVLRALPDFDPARPVLPWLHGIAFHVARNHLRRKRTHRQETLMDPGALDRIDPAPDPEQQTAAEQAREMVIQLMQGIDLDRRVVLSMHDLDGMSMPDIGRELRITESAGYKRLHTARRELKAAADRLSAQERRVLGLTALVPVDLTMLLDADRHIPDMPPSTRARVWARLQGALALGGPGAVSAPLPMPPPLPSAAARAAAFAGRHGAPFVLGAVVGAAALHALGPRSDPPVSPVAEAAQATIVASGAPATPVPAEPAAAAPSVTASATATASPAGVLAEDEGDLILRARAAHARGDLPGALAALDRHARRFPAGRLAAERDALRAQIIARQRATAVPSGATVVPSAPVVPTSRRMFGTDP